MDRDAMAMLTEDRLPFPNSFRVSGFNADRIIDVARSLRGNFLLDREIKTRLSLKVKDL